MPTVATRKKSKKRNLFTHVVKLLTPIRILKQARQLYMKGLQDCSAGLGYAGAGSYPAVPTKMNFNEQQIELMEMVANRSVGKKNGVDMQGRRRPVMAYNGVKRNYCVGLGKMGRIDEDKPCCFEEDQTDMKTRLLFLHPTIRSYAINRHVMHYY
ncbi:hypothetical protein L6164_035798 [Bauhinia variegata]|uniref:Uncharacterized protein n=1 Tax=Bauhinia variegata TaxID=167791 RepID=A0ACB9KF67_BAUVA|nr:hypothetical protein L6164_035798 [Bauhinia variegata]